MINDSHTYGENISQVERKILSMVDELFNLSNDDETFDPGGGENDVLLNKGENNDLNVLTIRTFLPFVTYPEVLPESYSTGSEDKVFNPGFVGKGVVAITTNVSSEWGSELRTPVMFVAISYLGERPKKGYKGQKRSKNSQKPTRNERDKNKNEEIVKDQSRISRYSKKGS
ncbi:hypothetical protein Tco_1009959 [Tanacetum coccineum]